jgi:hypothetical protein
MKKKHMKTIKNLFATILCMFAFLTVTANAVSYNWTANASGILWITATNSTYATYQTSGNIVPTLGSTIQTVFYQTGETKVYNNGTFGGTLMTADDVHTGALYISWTASITGQTVVNGVVTNTYTGTWYVLYGTGYYYGSSGNGYITSGVATSNTDTPPPQIQYSHGILGNLYIGPPE